MKLVFDHLGPTKRSRSWSFDLLPRAAVHVYDDSGYINFAWLMLMVELQWEYAK